MKLKTYVYYALQTEIPWRVFSVYVSDTPDWNSGSLCYQHDINEPVGNSVGIDCFTTGRYVTIYNSRNGSQNSTLSTFAYINICEVNITGKRFIDNMTFQLYVKNHILQFAIEL